jgi:kynurenine formamidase
VHGFRVGLPSPDAGGAEIATLFIASLGQLPVTGARFTAVPLRIEATGIIPVRAFARLPE